MSTENFFNYWIKIAVSAEFTILTPRGITMMAKRRLYTEHKLSS